MSIVANKPGESDGDNSDYLAIFGSCLEANIYSGSLLYISNSLSKIIIQNFLLAKIRILLNFLALKKTPATSAIETLYIQPVAGFICNITAESRSN